MLNKFKLLIVGSLTFIAISCGVNESNSNLNLEAMPSGKRVFSVQGETTSSMELSEIVSAIENPSLFCESGCQYKASLVKEQVVLGLKNDQTVVHNTTKTPFGDESMFVLSRTVVEEGKTLVLVTIPSKEVLEELKAEYPGRQHNPTFDLTFKIRYTLTAVEAGTKVKLEIAAESSKYSPKTFIVGGTIKGKLNENVKVLLSNY